jgi:hypothetical protein
MLTPLGSVPWILQSWPRFVDMITLEPPVAATVLPSGDKLIAVRFDTGG